MNASLYRWTGISSRALESRNVGLIDAVQLVARLNGKEHTELSIESDSGWSLLVGGGPCQYVIVKFDGSGNGYTLLNAQPVATGQVQLCVGGQDGDFAADIVFGREAAEQAIYAFFDNPAVLGSDWRHDQS